MLTYLPDVSFDRIPVADVAAGDGPTLLQKNLVPHPPANPPSQRRHMDVQISKSNNHAPAIISIEPFQVSSSTDSPRQPTLQECQKIIKKLSIENDRQSLEVTQCCFQLVSTKINICTQYTFDRMESVIQF